MCLRRLRVMCVCMCVCVGGGGAGPGELSGTPRASTAASLGSMPGGAGPAEPIGMVDVLGLRTTPRGQVCVLVLVPLHCMHAHQPHRAAWRSHQRVRACMTCASSTQFSPEACCVPHHALGLSC